MSPDEKSRDHGGNVVAVENVVSPVIKPGRWSDLVKAAPRLHADAESSAPWYIVDAASPASWSGNPNPEF